ncbi:MAG: VanZ family protein [Lachnospiraceae bacterium]|nr:VanZ family protein [Lachnospiraceae bacterium]
MNEIQTNRRRRKGAALLVLYLVLLVYSLLFAKFYGRDAGFSEHRYNLIPMREIVRFYTYWQQVGFISAFLNLAGNLVGFIPFGILVPMVSRRMRSWRRIVKAGFLLTLILESLQLFLKAGIFDVDDLILNTAGVLVGYQIYWLFSRFRR